MTADEAEGDELLVSLLSPEGRRSPYAVYDALRRQFPVYRSALGNQTLVSRFDDVLVVLREPRFAKVFDQKLRNQGRWQDGRLSPESSMRARLLLNLDPPDHTRLRATVQDAFSPGSIGALRERIAATIDETLDAVAYRDEIDLVEPSSTIAGTVIAEILGLPMADLPLLSAWARDGAATSDPMRPPEVEQRGEVAALGFHDYFTSLVADRRRAPRDDLVTKLAVGSADAFRDDDELVGLVTTMFIAGFETSADFLPMAASALASAPDQLALVRDDQTLLPHAVEELLRWDAPIQLTTRTATADVTVGGERIEEGTTVVCLLGSANRDPAQFGDPDTIDVTRTRAHGVPFGGGIHYCLGAALARLESEEFLRRLLKRLGGFELAKPVEWRGTLVFRGPSTAAVTAAPA